MAWSLKIVTLRWLKIEEFAIFFKIIQPINRLVNESMSLTANLQARILLEHPEGEWHCVDSLGQTDFLLSRNSAGMPAHEYRRRAVKCQFACYRLGEHFTRSWVNFHLSARKWQLCSTLFLFFNFSWFYFSELVRSNKLLKTQLITMPTSECNATLLQYNRRAKLAALRNGISESQYCAFDPQGRNDTCQGDSGGPLQYFPTKNSLAHVIGVVSFGIGCGNLLPGRKKYSSVYFNSLYSSVDQINKCI